MKRGRRTALSRKLREKKNIQKKKEKKKVSRRQQQRMERLNWRAGVASKNLSPYASGAEGWGVVDGAKMLSERFNGYGILKYETLVTAERVLTSMWNRGMEAGR